MKNLIGEKVRFALDFPLCLYFSWFSSIGCSDGGITSILLFSKQFETFCVGLILTCFHG